MTRIAGIDPGLNGAVAFLDGDIVETHPMPVLLLKRGKGMKGEIDAHALAALLWGGHAEHVIVEAVGAMPGQGVTSSFAFGKGFGVVLGILAAIGSPYTLVPPRTWKGAIGVNSAKAGSVARASQLFPANTDQWALKKAEGRAEAALLAYYGRQVLNGASGD